MPVTHTEWPILSSFLCAVSTSTTGMPLPLPLPPSQQQDDTTSTANVAPLNAAPHAQRPPPKKLPKGVVLDKDGKPYVKPGTA